MSVLDDPLVCALSSGLVPKAIGRRRRGRFFWLGGFEIETGSTFPNHVFFDPIGGEDHTGCVPWPDESEVFSKAEDAIYDALVEPGLISEREMNRFVPLCRECRVRLGGHFEFNFRGYQVEVRIPGRLAYAAANAMNRVLVAWEEARLEERTFDG